jgi:MFS family permease
MPRATTAALVLAVFTVSVGYGVVLPLLPDLVERMLGPGTSTAPVSRHTGLLTATYALALFLAAPAWGWLSDAHGRRNALLAGLIGFSVATAVFSLVESITAIYVQRFLSGLFAAAAMPVAWAGVSDVTAPDEARGRRLAFISMASVAGFLIGPTLGVFVTRMGTDLLTFGSQVGSITIPLASTAMLAALVSIVVAAAVPNGQRSDLSEKAPGIPAEKDRPVIMRLLVLTFIVSAGLGAFEVGLALRGTQQLNLRSYQVALMFTECSLVMFAAQAVVFSPWIRADTTRWFITPALFALMTGLFFVPWASTFWLMLAAIGGVAASVGVLAPILTYWISTGAGMNQGWELGKQAAASSLGITAGSAAGGLFFSIGGVPGASFVLAAVLVAVGLFLSLTLPRALELDTFGHQAPKNAAP